MTRDELYALVWETPSVHVASRLGMTNAALRKLCDTYDVPVPPAGYWTKVAYGKAPARTPLPKEAPTLLKKIGSALRRIGETSLDMTDAQIADYHLDLSAAPLAAPAQAERKTAVDRFTQLLRAAPADENGFVSVSLADLIECRVGAASQDRAIALADLLLKTALGFDFVLSDGEGLIFDGERVALRIYETRVTPSRVTPSGRFCLELFDPRPFQWTRRNLIGHWHDRLTRPVEQLARSAITAAINAAPIIRRVRAAAQAKEGAGARG